MTKQPTEKELLQRAVDYVALYGGIGKAVKETQIPTEILGKRHADAIRKGFVPSPGILEAVAREKAENTTPKFDDGTMDEMIQDLVRVYEAENKKVTPKTYERFGAYEPRLWQMHFNDWNNFLRRAGLKPHKDMIKADTQLARVVEGHIYEKDNALRQTLGTKYERPTNKSVITFAAAGDLHDNMCDPFFRRVYIETVRVMQPDIIILHGDVYDMYTFSSYPKDPAWDNINPAFDWCDEFFRDLRNACPNAQIDLLEGNHEFRLWKAYHAFPMFRQVMGRMGLGIAQIMGLEKYQINYIGRSDLSLPPREKYMTNARERNSKVYFGAFKADHYPPNKKFPSAWPGFNGHHHKYHATETRSDMFGPNNWIQTGCGHALRADYMPADNWTMGFLTGRVNTSYEYPKTTFEYWHVHDDAQIQGMYFERDWATEFVAHDHANKLKKA